MAMEYNPEKIGNIIKKERELRKWSQSRMGKELNISGKQISIYENGTLPPLDNLLKICSIFNVELGYLLGEDDYQKGSKLETQIYNLTGLTNESIEVLKYLTSPTSKFHFGHQSESIRKIVNAFICAESFPSLIEAFFSIYSCWLSVDNLGKIYNETFSDSVRNQANEILTSSIDYEHEPTVDRPSDEVLQAYRMLNSIIDEQYNQDFQAKVGRYEAIESLILLLNQMFDRENNIIDD